MNKTNTYTSFEYVGNLHIHSHYSDGTASVAELAETAQRTGLDFIIINDHDYMTDELHLEKEGFYGGVMVMMGIEIGKRFHHYLAYGLQKMVHDESQDPQKVINDVNQLGGFGFMAHPFEKGMPFTEKSIAYTWNNLKVTGYTGISIWNFSSRWKERIKSVVHGLFFLLFKRQTLKGPSSETLRFWDQHCRDRRIVAIGTSDAHGSEFKWGWFRFTPLTYDWLLNSINVHIYLDQPINKDFLAAKEAVYHAIKQGHLYLAHDNLFPAAGFHFYYLTENGAKIDMGDEAEFTTGELHIALPVECKIRLIRNGILEWAGNGRKTSYRVRRSGIYRVEVYRRTFLFGWRPWIFSNPIYLR